MSTTKTYLVTGMTCDHCVKAVTQELSLLSGVSEVTVTLEKDHPSPVVVTSEVELDHDAVVAAIDEAGYELAET